MAAPPSSHATLSHSQKQLRSPASTQRSESDYDFGISPSSLQNTSPGSDLLSQFERVLHKALQNTSDAITNKLTREICEVGRSISILEQRVDEFDVTASNQAEELEFLTEEYSSLQSSLEDLENRNRISNLRICGIPEAIEDLQSTATALFQEFAPFIPIERLEMDRIHRSLTPRKEDGPPRDIIIKLHYFRTKEQLLEAAHSKESLIFQGHRCQIYQDPSQQMFIK